MILTLLFNTILSLSGNQKITPQDYVGLGAQALANSLPSCGIPYGNLNLNLITAVQGLNKTIDCYKCLQVTNVQNDHSVYVMAVDTGGQGLDLSTTAFSQLFGQATDPAPATWSEVDPSYCDGIITNGSPSQNTYPSYTAI